MAAYQEMRELDDLQESALRKQGSFEFVIIANMTICDLRGRGTVSHGLPVTVG